MSAVFAEERIDVSTDVEAVLNYTRKTDVRPVNYTFDPPPGVPRYSGEVDARTVTIHDGRRLARAGLDVSGFELIRHRSTLVDWASFGNTEKVTAIDYPEVEAALKAHTGADKVVLFDHTLRDSTAEPGQAALREPVRRVHDVGADRATEIGGVLGDPHVAPARVLVVVADQAHEQVQREREHQQGSRFTQAALELVAQALALGLDLRPGLFLDDFRATRHLADDLESGFGHHAMPWRAGWTSLPPSMLMPAANGA